MAAGHAFRQDSPLRGHGLRPAAKPHVSRRRAGGRFIGFVSKRSETDDCQASYEQLSARGVTFNEPPTVQPYGIDTSFRDPSGNNVRLTQVLDFDPVRGTGIA